MDQNIDARDKAPTPLLENFEDSDFDALWVSATDPHQTPKDTPENEKLGGLNFSWDSVSSDDPLSESGLGLSNLPPHQIDDAVTHCTDTDATIFENANDITVNTEAFFTPDESEFEISLDTDIPEDANTLSDTAYIMGGASSITQPENLPENPSNAGSTPNTPNSENPTTSSSTNKEDSDCENRADDSNKPKTDENLDDTKTSKEDGTNKTDDSDKPKTDENDAENAEIVKSVKICLHDAMPERARMGRVEPENEVQTANHTLHHDVIYDDGECEASPRNASRYLKIFLWVAVLLLTTCVIVGAVFVFQKMQTRDVSFAKKGVFQLGNSQFSHIDVSDDGKFKALCSNQRGVVLNQNNHPIHEFWPDGRGCQAIRISKHGDTLWFVNQDNSLKKIDLASSHGFNAETITVLPHFSGNFFEINAHEAAWVGSKDGIHPVLFKKNLSSNAIQEIEIPEDAYLCNGLHNGGFAYVKDDTLHLATNEEEIRVPLDAPKFGCQQTTLLGCVYSGDGNWAIVCQNSIRQGHNKNAHAPVSHEITGLRSGAVPFKLLNHANGTDLITPQQWIHLDARNNITQTDITPNLGNTFDIAYQKTDNAPLFGINDGHPVDISNDGQRIDAQTPSQWTHIGNAFVGNGSHMVTIFNQFGTQTRGRVALWDLLEGRLIESVTLDAAITSLNLSTHNRYGFVQTGTSPSKLTWIDYQIPQILGSIPLVGGIQNVQWNDNENNVLIKYSTGITRLYERRPNGILLKREYPRSITVGFAQNDLLWYIDSHNVMLQRIEDGALSVNHEKITHALENADIQNITHHPYTGDSYFWGFDGAWRFSPSTRRITQITGADIQWLTPDPTGKTLATSAGIFDLESSARITEIPKDLAGTKLYWIGTTKLLKSPQSPVIFDYENGKIIQTSDKASLKFYGQSAGLHPTHALIASNCDDMTILSQIRHDSNTNIAGILAGNDSHSWCLATANDAFQGIGNLCISLEKLTNGKTSPLKATVANVTNFLHTLMPPSDFPAKQSAPIPFTDKVHLNITTVPEKASLLFVASDGAKLPKQLPADTFVDAPFNTELQRNASGLAVAAMAPGYATRAVPFIPVTENINLRIPLLLNGAENITLKSFDTSARPITEMSISENLEIELKSILQENKDIITTCLTPAKIQSFSISIDHAGTLAIPTNNDALTACMKTLTDNITQKRKQNALPELNDYSDIQFDITMP